MTSLTGIIQTSEPNEGSNNVASSHVPAAPCTATLATPIDLLNQDTP